MQLLKVSYEVFNTELKESRVYECYLFAPCYDILKSFISFKVLGVTELNVSNIPYFNTTLNECLYVCGVFASGVKGVKFKDGIVYLKNISLFDRFNVSLEQIQTKSQLLAAKIEADNLIKHVPTGGMAGGWFEALFNQKR